MKQKITDIDNHVKKTSPANSGDTIRVNDYLRSNITPNDFIEGTQMARIKNALAFLKKQGGGTLELGVDTVAVPNTNTWTITESIILPSNTTLFLNNSKLKLANGVFDTIIRNEGIIVDAENPNGLALELRQNSNIKIIGTGVGNAFIEGPDVPYSAPHPIDGGAAIPWIGDFYGWRTVSILFANCKNYEMGGFSISKTTCWAISQEHGCDNMYIHDIDFNTTVKNGDGIDFRKGCSNGVVRNITGAASDDIIACVAMMGSNKMPFPRGNYVYPMQVGGYEDSILGNNVDNIMISNISASSIHHVLICYAAGGGRTQNIKAYNIEDTYDLNTRNIVCVYSGHYAKTAIMGEINNIYMNRIISNNSNLALNINTPLLNSHFNHIEQKKEGGIVCEITPPHDTQMINVQITNCLPGLRK
ncbi:MAG: hypothetical protein ABIK53_06515 [bacterium]